MAKKRKNNDFSHDTILASYGGGKYLMGPSTAKEPKGNWRAGKVGDVFGNTRVVDFRSLNDEWQQRSQNMVSSKKAQMRFLATEKKKSTRGSAAKTLRSEKKASTKNTKRNAR